MQWDMNDFVGMGMGEVSLTAACTQVPLRLMTESHTPEPWRLVSQLGRHVLGAGALGQSCHWAAGCPLHLPLSAPAECAQVLADPQPRPQPWHGEGEAAG